jgi:hypothetical protein
VVHRIQRQPRQRLMVVQADRLHLIREPLGTSGLKEGAAGAVGECKLRHGEEGETDHRLHKQSPQKRRNGGTPVGYSGRRREQCGV